MMYLVECLWYASDGGVEAGANGARGSAAGTLRWVVRRAKLPPAGTSARVAKEEAMSDEPTSDSGNIEPQTERAMLSDYFAAIQPALVEWEGAWHSAKKALRIPGKVGGSKWREVEERMRRVAALDEEVAASLATVSPPETVRKVHAGLIAALRLNAKTFSSNARNMHDGIPLKEWSSFKTGSADSARFKRLVNDWRLQVKAEAKRLDVMIPFRRLLVFRQSLS
jgi:hypothetical protein